MSQRIIGKCSLCGGRVILETVQWIVGPMMPAQCESCGAYHDDAQHLPTLPMTPCPPRGEMHFVQNGKVVGRIVNIGEEP